MQLHLKIETARVALAATKRRSVRRVELHRDLVRLMVKQLRRENRQDRRK